jgi:hypothetical protein
MILKRTKVLFFNLLGSLDNFVGDLSGSGRFLLFAPWGKSGHFSKNYDRSLPKNNFLKNCYDFPIAQKAKTCQTYSNNTHRNVLRT